MSTVDVLQDLITRRGGATLAWLRGWSRLLHFSGTAVVQALSPATYNSATRSVVQKQIYFTAWQILPGFTLFATVLSFVLIEIVVNTARDYGLSVYALEMTIRVLVLEILPLITVLFVALRSGAAINTEVALMNITNEMQALEKAGVDPMQFEFIPRVIGGTISVLSLAALSSAVALVQAYFVVYGFQLWSLPEFSSVVGEVFDLPSTLLLWLKVLFFGLAVTVIPISEGLAAPRKLFFAPIAVLRGMVRLFFVIMLIEVASLALRYI
jgi:phospholipid/cholesterol/gamma-HCH transport system permease protein